VAWDGGKFYENGLMRGKQAMIIGAAGHPAEYYQENGIHKMDINQVLEPINRGVLAFCGFNIHESYMALNVLGADQPMLEKSLKELQFRLENLANSPQWHTFYN
jgi:NAD(P)H dehydrogenase (quinone)